MRNELEQSSEDEVRFDEEIEVRDLEGSLGFDKMEFSDWIDVNGLSLRAVYLERLTDIARDA